MLEEKDKSKEKEKDKSQQKVNDQESYRNYSKENPFYFERKLFKIQELYNQSSINILMCLYKYSLTEIKQNPIEIENDKLVKELFESFSYLFPKEKCKYALEKKNYDMEQAAEYLIKLSKEPKEIEEKIKQPEELYKNYEICSKIILYEGTCKLDNTNKTNELIILPELKSKFDLSKFECLKWILVKDKLYAYKLKDAGAFVFGTKKKDEKEFTVEFNESIMFSKAQHN